MKKSFLSESNYGQGCVHIFILAESKEDIYKQYPRIKILETIPSWMTDEQRERTLVVDIDNQSDSYLLRLQEN